MVKGLRNYFPTIRTKNEILQEIRQSENLNDVFNSWREEQQKEFLDFTSGMKGVKILYDAFFKEVFNPESKPERLEALLSLLLKQKVKIKSLLPGDNSRIADENSLLIMDILVELEDGSLANIECQKIGYKFPGQRSACYSADLLLRQYKRVRGEKGKAFSYKDVKKVYTIVLFETSTDNFHKFPDDYVHHAKAQVDTGLEIELLQEYVFIPLDIFRQNLYNRGMVTPLDAWLTFLSEDDPVWIERLIQQYPEFIPLYGEVYAICKNVERVMGIFSEELQILDRNTVQLMIDEMQDEIDEMKILLGEKDETIIQNKKTIVHKDELLSQKDEEIKRLKKLLESQSASLT
jgi:hypothetical protein